VGQLNAAVLADPDLARERRDWLRSYDAEPLARYTVIDDRFETLTGQPIRTVLDFGSGIGRQVYLWGHRRQDARVYSVDEVESLYLLQAEAYRRLFGARAIEYFSETSFESRCAQAPADAVVHLPTWRLDAIPGASVDLALCIQVLPEIPGDAVRAVLRELRRVVRPDGLLYIRDKEFWAPTHALRIGRLLLEDGVPSWFRRGHRDRRHAAPVGERW
jgi:SAM-dependent methyltransferase